MIYLTNTPWYGLAMTPRSRALGDIPIFLLILASLSLLGHGAMNAYKLEGLAPYGFLMWSVTFAAMATAKLRGIDVAGFGWGWGPVRYHLIAIVVPLVYCLFGYSLAAALGLVEFGATERIARFAQGYGFEELQLVPGYLAAALLAVLGGGWIGLALALGEEIGWRGFLTPRMNLSFGFLLGTLLTGLIWAGWHMPALVLGQYNAGGVLGWEIASFTVMIVATCGVFAWLRMASGSLWPAMMLHGAHNLLIQGFFDALTERGASPVTMVGEFGVIFAAVCVTVCAPFWVLGYRHWKSCAAN